ncbi:MAG: hypothetical protein H7141_08750 [Burkholderiales bacterium]|nr:hypothetical protein [Bacteroidia bacterium]
MYKSNVREMLFVFSCLKLTPIPAFIYFGFIVSLFSSCNGDIKIPSQTTKNENTTFVEIAPIIFKNCTPCHRQGESGPFELMTYRDAKKNANKIKFVTQTKYMPPWPADAEYSHFVGERALSQEEIELIKIWVENGAPEGDASNIPTAPVYYTGSFLRKPDTVIKFKNPVPIKGNGTDHFYVVKLPMQLPKDTFVSYFEFVPNQRKLAHHINGHLINYTAGNKKDIQHGLTYALDAFKDYKELYAQMNILNDDGTFPVLTPNTVYYLPGYTPPIYPAGVGGHKVNKTSAILLKNIHYGPSSIDVLDSSYINVFYGSKPKRPVFETQMGTFGISKIEPELILHPNKVETFHTQATMNNDISLLSVNPHMHLLGKSFWAFALQPSGDTIPLIKINKWDFKWQYYYTYQHPVILKAGSTIHVYGTFDNTDKNPFNPNHPPKIVTQGEGVKSMQTTEEMFQFIFSYLPYQKGDEKMDLSKKNN